MENAIVEFVASLLGSFFGYLVFTRTNINFINVRLKSLEVQHEEKHRKLAELDKDIQKLYFGFDNLSGMIKTLLTKLQS